MAWDNDLQVLGAQKEIKYLGWADENKKDESETANRLWGTKAGYEQWVKEDLLRRPDDYARAKAEYDATNSFPHWFAEQTWRPGPFKRKKKIELAAAPCLFSFAGVDISPTCTYRDSSAEGGYRTVAITERTGTVGDFLRDVAAEEADHQAHGERIAEKRAIADAMLAEAGGDETVLIAKIALKKEQASEAA